MRTIATMSTISPSSPNNITDPLSAAGSAIPALPTPGMVAISPTYGA
jgi:hypothetical protein